MKELTAAQGLLRCGECDTIFDAMKALSTTLPEERTFADTDAQVMPAGLSGKPNNTRIRVLPTTPAKLQTGRLREASTDFTRAKPNNKQSSRSRKLLLLSLGALAVLLLLQLAYTSRHFLMEHPFTAKMSQNLCTLIGCELETPRDVSKIRVLSRSVYSHPNAPKLLIISSSIQNDAPFEQPFPLLEISFLNSASEVIALRRFTPQDYIGQDSNNKLMQPGVPSDFSVNISDPGQEAVNFQFRFL